MTEEEENKKDIEKLYQAIEELRNKQAEYENQKIEAKDRHEKSLQKGTFELSAFIDEWVYSKRNRDILKDRLIDGVKIPVLSKEYDISERQIKNIIKKFKVLEKEMQTIKEQGKNLR